MDHAVNVVTVIEPGNSHHAITSPPCQRCGKWTVTYRMRDRPECELVQLKLSYKASVRQKLKKLVRESRLPKEEFARCVLGVDPTTLFSYLKGGTIPDSRLAYMHSIESVSRSGGYIHTVTRCPDRPRWNHMLYTRDYIERR